MEQGGVTIAAALITGFLPPRGFSLCCKTSSPLCAIKVASVNARVASGRALAAAAAGLVFKQTGPVCRNRFSSSP